MFQLAFRSVLVLGLLFGLLFAIATGFLYAIHAPLIVAVLLALVMLGIQFAIAPWIIEWVHKINWVPAASVDPRLAEFIRQTCEARGIPEPRFGIIEDGNPNAFTFGHYPGNARVVITRGIVDLLDEEEREAVVAHELGHIIHWDFVVMTVAAAVPLILYYIFRFGIRAGRGRNRNSGGIVLVAIAAFIAYWISQYLVLFLSRVREYYADHFSAYQTERPNALATALVKIAYGLAAAPKEKEEQGERKDQVTVAAQGAKSLGIFDPNFGSSLALAAAGSYAMDGTSSPERTVEAMRWDIWNPWAFVCEIGSTHPLPAKRLRQLDRIAEKMGQKPTYDLPNYPPESYWDEFAVDLLAHYAVLILGALGVAAAFVLSGGHPAPLAAVGAGVLGLGLGWLARTRYAYPREQFRPWVVENLVGQVKVSKVRSIPCEVEGTIIGRGVPGLYWSEDLVIQDRTGFLVLDYRQPLRILEWLFGLFRAESFIGQAVRARGWFRRFPRPFVELWKVYLPDGSVHTCYNYLVALWGSVVVSLIGLVILVVAVVGQV